MFKCYLCFLLSDRMSGLGIKTPVSCLQEYVVSKKMIPQYELIHSGGSSHNPEFTFRVQVGALWEEGTGRSKQDAKHRAAEKLLKTLKIIDSNDDFKPEGDEINDFNQEPAENYVGQLKDLCRNIHYPDPRYYLEEASGPSHDRVFKMICCVSHLQDFGISKTKKQAKQQAASKMLQRLKEVGGKKIEDCLNNIEISNKIASPSMTNEEILDKYNALKTCSTVTTCEDPAAFYKDNHKAYVALRETSPTLNKVLSESNITDIESSLSLMEKIAKELGAELSAVETPTKQMEIKFTIMTMSVCPPVGAVGVSKKQAAFNLLNSLLILSKE